MTNFRPRFFTISLVLAAALGLSACDKSPEVAKALGEQVQTLTSERDTATAQLKAEQVKLAAAEREKARLAAELKLAQSSAQAERNAKWRARIQTEGAVKVAKAAVAQAAKQRGHQTGQQAAKG